MDANLMNQFILATGNVFQQVAGLSLHKEKVDYHPEGAKFYANVATIIGITGALKGQLIVGIDEAMAMKFASAIMMGTPVEEYNEFAESGVCEMGNMIAGEASRRLHDQGYTCDLSVPSIVRGESVEIGFFPKSPLFSVTFTCEWGKIQIIIKLEGK